MATLKTVVGLALASVKTYGALAVASIDTILGLTLRDAGRQAQVPGAQYANETSTSQAQVPGGAYMNEGGV